MISNTPLFRIFEVKVDSNNYINQYITNNIWYYIVTKDNIVIGNPLYNKDIAQGIVDWLNTINLKALLIERKSLTNSYRFNINYPKYPRDDIQ